MAPRCLTRWPIRPVDCLASRAIFVVDTHLLPGLDRFNGHKQHAGDTLLRKRRPALEAGIRARRVVGVDGERALALKRRILRGPVDHCGCARHLQNVPAPDLQPLRETRPVVLADELASSQRHTRKQAETAVARRDEAERV